MKNKILLLVITFSLTACDGLLVSGPRSDLGYYYDPDIAGIDLNNNGIRDDVEDYIANYKFEGKPITVQQKDALEQLARAEQLSLITLFNNKAELIKNTEEIFTGMKCVQHRFYPEVDAGKLTGETPTTKKEKERARYLMRNNVNTFKPADDIIAITENTWKRMQRVYKTEGDLSGEILPNGKLDRLACLK